MHDPPNWRGGTRETRPGGAMRIAIFPSSTPGTCCSICLSSWSSSSFPFPTVITASDLHVYNDRQAAVQQVPQNFSSSKAGSSGHTRHSRSGGRSVLTRSSNRARVRQCDRQVADPTSAGSVTSMPSRPPGNSGARPGTQSGADP